MDTFSLQDEGVKKKSGFKALLIEIGAIIVLIVVMIFVLNYLKIINISSFFPGQSSNPSQISETTQKAQQILTSSPVPTQPKPQNPLQVLDTISKNKALHYAFKELEFEGIISLVDEAPGFDTINKTSYQVRLLINVGSGSDMVDLYYPQEALGKIKILDSKKKELTFKDLKKGDLVTIRTNMGLLPQYPNNFNEVVITKK